MRETSETDGIRLYHATLPMRHGFDHPAASRCTSDSLLLELTADGESGFGECAPRPYVTGETADGVSAQLRERSARGLFETLRSRPAEELVAALRTDGFSAVFGIGGGNNLVCLLELAVLDLLGRRLGRAAADLLPTTPGAPPAPGSLRISQVLDLGTHVEDFLATRGPFHFVKVKASHDLARDLATVTRLRQALGPEVPVMVDANMSWEGDQAVDHVRRLTACGVTLFEEPLRKGAYDDLRALRLSTGASVMLDESVCGLDDARAAVRAGACDAFNIRVSKCGGLFASARIAEFAREHGLAFQVGVQVAEVGPLVFAGRQLAFRLPDALTVESGQSDRYFARPLVSPPPVVDRVANTVSPAPGPGLGTVLDTAAERWAVARYTPDTDQWHGPAPRRRPRKG
ncbi:mandelate racemase/muconate lactonizing enzyme family protein [Streptomyces sioyaensis]|uniref:mandelate racemase/muconate lactonizing enzyme family protein n=1 Tax=Streptomyces sioyaensis TaxID=67364 RepID=UPI0037D94CD3